MASFRTMGFRSMSTWLRLAAFAAVTASMAALSASAVAGVDLPKLERGKAEKCVDDTEYMRRHHPDLLKHQRNETLRKGIRTTKYSLKKCVECHASEKTGSVAASKEDFCVACHSYAAVKPDCWDCHATKPAKKALPEVAAPGVSPLLSVPVATGASGESK